MTRPAEGAAAAKPALNQYTLFTGDQGAYRLGIISDIYNDGSKVFLTNNGVADAKKILIVGCGTGIMLQWIAEQAKGAEILATDIDPKQIEVSRKAIVKAGIKNVTFQVCDGHDLESTFSDKVGYFDFTVTRFVLAHVQDPEDILRQMVTLTAKGGKVLCEEAITSLHACEPRNADFDAYYKAWSETRKSKNANPEFGSTLEGLYSGMGLGSLSFETRTKELPVGSREREIFYLNMVEIEAHVLQAGLMNEADHTRIRDAMKALKDSPEHTLRFSGSMQICGTSPGPEPKAVAEARR
ncbi:MAG: methyltransferase domain-containing protein [Gammaproteobacteria bacterium]|nr:methyltransferase domain-containing protein [Gammaproteobacteria bacterium]MCH9743527.1 methyltransferase domain-containing protein [Gammaproteobacteria bacterium]